MELAVLLFAYAGGLACAPCLRLPPGFLALPFTVAFGYLAARKTSLALPLLLLFFWSLGIALYHQALAPPASPSHILAFASEKQIGVEGEILAISARHNSGPRIDLETRRVHRGDESTPAHGRLRLYVREGSIDLQPGDRIRFRSRLRQTSGFGTPGEFDFPRHLAYLETFVTAFVADTRDIALLAQRPGSGPSPLSPARWRTVLGRRIDQAVSTPTAPLVRALVIGDKGGISPGQKELLGRGGVSHLFAISGLHLGLIALWLYYAGLQAYRCSERLLLCCPPKRALPLLILPALLAYLLLTGNALPTRRAFVVAAALALLATGSRRTSALNLWTSAALVFLLIEPLALFQPAFQLSFAGVLGILVLVPRWTRAMRLRYQPLRWITGIALTTVAATLTTTPLVLYHFHLVAPAGVVTNLFALPVIGLVAVPLGAAGALMTPLSEPLSAGLFQGCALAIETSLCLVEQVTSWPLLAGWKRYDSPGEVLALALAVTALLCPGSPPRKRRLRGLALVGAVIFFWAPQLPPPKLTVTSLSVGQGDATLVSFAGDRHFLVDGGGLHGATFDVGERLLAPALGWLDVDSLEGVILSHNHPDHEKGLRHILGHFEVKEFWSPLPLSGLPAELAEILRARRIPVKRLPPGWTTVLRDSDLRMDLYTPHAPTGNPNDDSQLALAACGTDSVLLTGDIEKEGIRQLLATPLPGPVTLLKIPHHGSRSSAPETLLNALMPAAAFVSLGRNNVHKFPHSSVLEALERRRIPLWRTDTLGTLRFTSDGKGWQTAHWRGGLFH